MAAPSAPTVTPSAVTSSSSLLSAPFDPSSPLLVAKGVLVTGTLGAVTGASIGVVQSKNPFALSINMTINMSIASLTFFGIREYFVSPLLLATEATSSHSRRLRQLSDQQLSSKARGKLPEFEPPAPPLSISQVRTDRILDSALAGGLTGGTLSAAFRGRATFLRATVTGSVIGSLLQLSVNQLRVVRLQLLAKRAETISAASSPSTSAQLPSPTSTSDTSNIDPQLPMPSLQTSFDEPLKGPPPAKSAANARSLPERMMSAFTTFLPVRKLSDEQYLETLQRKRADVDKRLKEIEDEEKRMWDWASAQERK